MPPSVPPPTPSPITRQARQSLPSSTSTSSVKPKTKHATVASKQTARTAESEQVNVSQPLSTGPSPPLMSMDNSMMMMNPLSSVGMYGGGMYGGAMGSPYNAYGSNTLGPFSGLNQFLFGIQSVIFSLGQAVQIVSMNTQALHQLLDTATTMFDHTLKTWREMRALDTADAKAESEDDQKRRRRLRALRWAMMISVAYAGYRLIRRIVRSRRSRRGGMITDASANTYPSYYSMMGQPSSSTMGGGYDYGYGTTLRQPHMSSAGMGGPPWMGGSPDYSSGGYGMNSYLPSSYQGGRPY